MQLIAIFPSRDLDRAIDLYASFGFEPTYRQTGSEGYLILRSPALEIHFAAVASLDPAANTAAAYLRCENAAELSTLWSALSEHGFADHGVPRLTRPEIKPWGLLEFAFVDQDGNLLRVGTDGPH